MYCIDAAIRMADIKQNPEGLFLCILDLTGLVLKNCDVHGMLAIFSLLQHQYVERLGTLILYNAPMVFWGLWSVVKGFVDPVTRKKIVFANKSEGKAVFEDLFESQVLPECLGGTGRLIPAVEAVQELLQQQGVKPLQQKVQEQEQQQGEQHEQQQHCENTHAMPVVLSSGAVSSSVGGGAMSLTPPGTATVAAGLPIAA